MIELKKYNKMNSNMKFLSLVFPFFVLLIVSCGNQSNDSSNAANTATQPNIIVIYADDLGYGEMGAYGANECAESDNIIILPSFF